MNIPNNNPPAPANKGSSHSKSVPESGNAPNQSSPGSHANNGAFPYGHQASGVQPNHMIARGHEGSRNAASSTPAARGVEPGVQGSMPIAILGKAR